MRTLPNKRAELWLNYRYRYTPARCKEKELMKSAESVKPSYSKNHKEAMHAKTERGRVSHFHRSPFKRPGRLKSLSVFQVSNI